ncbi:MAG: alanyl-tRNA editing protein [bacterium]
MGTEKLYLQSPYTATFKAMLIAHHRDANGRSAAVLDQTYFYPESGGQPADSGTLGGFRVLDVQEDESGTVYHVVDGNPEPGEVECVVDWARRFDHMQQHTGQHILSRAFIEEGDLETVSFHLGDESCTIDLEGGPLDEDIARAAEKRANEVIWENLDVRVIRGSPEEIDTQSLRKSPPDGVTEVRLVEIDGFDVNACCGTHVRRTGELGMIKILRFEKAKGANRVYFEVGKRAYDDFVLKHGILRRLAGSFTTALENVEDNVEKLRLESRRLKKDSQRYAKELAANDAERLYGHARPAGGFVVVVEVIAGKSEEYLRLLASSLKTRENAVSLLATEDGLVLCNAPPGAGIDFSGSVIERAKSLGGTGGGKSGFATARLPSSVAVMDFLEKVFDEIKPR